MPVATQIEVRHTEGGKTIVRPIYGRDRSDYVGTWQLPFAITGSALVVGWINLWVRYAGLSYWGYGKRLATKGRMKWPVLLLIMPGPDLLKTLPAYGFVPPYGFRPTLFF